MEQITSGIAELDVILGGGFPRHSLNACPDAPALYLTTLSEPAAKMLRYLQRFPFFDEGKLLDAQPAIIYRDVAELIRDKGFQALPEILIALFDEPRPAYLVIDSFKALRDLGPMGPELRRALFDLAGSLAARACTTLIIGEYTAKEVEEYPEFAIADGIVCLVNKAYGTRDERYLRVLKLRGSDYRAGEHAFRITDHGLSVFPRLLTPREPPDYVSSSERVSTGVPGLDLMFDGVIQLLAVRGVTVYVTNVSPGDPESTPFASMSASYISDNVVALRYVVEGEVGTDRSIGRSLTIVKTRGSHHDPFIRRMTIGAHGVAVGQPRTR